MSCPHKPFGAYAHLLYSQTKSLSRTARFWGRALVRPDLTGEWLSFLETHPAFSKASDRVRSVLVDKINRPFARCALDPAGRVALLKNHYDIAVKAIPLNALHALVAGERLVLARLQNPKTGETYPFTLAREMVSQHQGELTFLMHDEAEEIPLARIVVNLTYDEKGRRTLLLNGIQGPKPLHKGLIVQITRALFGLRPKRAVLEIIYAFAAWLNIERIVATAKANHVSQAKERWRRKIHTDYDEFWQEVSLATLSDGDYEMPLSLPCGKAEEVPSKKRKNWILRHRLLQSLTDQTTEILEKIGRP